eukprot:m.82651 g.82651  ORF g.82651 m.82651 type:complete len:495 (+) comp12883_c0_seq1:145-1629(+)
MMLARRLRSHQCLLKLVNNIRCVHSPPSAYELVANVKKCILVQDEGWSPPSLSHYSVPPYGFHDWNYDEYDWQKEPFRELKLLGIEVEVKKVKDTQDVELLLEKHASDFVVGSQHIQQLPGSISIDELTRKEVAHNLNIVLNRHTLQDTRHYWKTTPFLQDVLDGGVQCVMEMVSKNNDEDSNWQQATEPEIKTWGCWQAEVDGQLSTCLIDHKQKRRLILMRANHSSFIGSGIIQNALHSWPADVLVLESDVVQAEDALKFLLNVPEHRDSEGFNQLRYGFRSAMNMTMLSCFLGVFVPSILPILSIWVWVMSQFFVKTDILLSLRAAKLQGTHVVLADWQRQERGSVSSICKALDAAGRAYSVEQMGRNYNRGQYGWQIDSISLLQLLIGPTLLPKVPYVAFNEFFHNRHKHEPHDYFLFEKRNDLLAASIDNVESNPDDSEYKNILAVVGSAHVPGIVERLTNNSFNNNQYASSWQTPIEFDVRGHARMQV